MKAKKLLFPCVILLCLITLALLAVDLFLFSVSAWIVLFPLTVLVALSAYLILRVPVKNAAKAWSGILAAATCLLSLFGIYCNPYFNSIVFHGDIYMLKSHPDTLQTLSYREVLDADKACADLDYTMKYLCKLHPALMTEAQRAPYLSLAEQAKAEIRAQGSIRVNDLAARIERILSRLNDAHTYMSFSTSDLLYFRHYDDWKKDGWQITAVNGTPLRQLLEQNRELFSYEVESWGIYKLGGTVVSAQGLDWLGFDVANGVVYTFENSDGHVEEVRAQRDDFVTYDEYLRYNNLNASQQAEEPFVSFVLDKDRSLALFTLTQCKYNDEYIACVRDLFTSVKANDIRNVAVDLRKNGGGNSLVADEFIRYLDIDRVLHFTYIHRLGIFRISSSDGVETNRRYSDLTFNGNLYLLTSSGTFSSAMDFAEIINANHLGSIIGEPPGNVPSGYGDISLFQTPNAKLLFQISTKEFFRADRGNPDLLVMPDIPCDAKLAMDVLYEQINAS